jgi:hypothetical protein
MPRPKATEHEWSESPGQRYLFHIPGLLRVWRPDSQPRSRRDGPEPVRNAERHGYDDRPNDRTRHTDLPPYDALPFKRSANQGHLPSRSGSRYEDRQRSEHERGDPADDLLPRQRQEPGPHPHHCPSPSFVDHSQAPYPGHCPSIGGADGSMRYGPFVEDEDDMPLLGPGPASDHPRSATSREPSGISRGSRANSGVSRGSRSLSTR